MQLVSTMTSVEQKLNVVCLHVLQYQAQRSLVKHIVSIAKNDVNNNLPVQFRRKVIIINMGQNLGPPNFEGEQPGGTYYFSPLTVLLFGIVDNVTEDGFDRMDAYIWREQDGDRGANNICSCLYKYFKMRGWIQRNYGKLSIVADHCGGQNKNRVVVRFLVWLVEMGYFPRIRLIFSYEGSHEECS